MSERKRNGSPSTAARSPGEALARIQLANAEKEKDPEMAALQREVGRKSLLAAQREDSAGRTPKDERRM